MGLITRNPRRSRTYDVQDTDNLDEVLTGINATAEAAAATAVSAEAAAQTAAAAALAAETAATGAYDRANHTGTQLATTISDFEAAVDARVALAGPSEVRGQAVVTVPANRHEWSETVAATGVTPAMGVMLTLGAHTDTDENTAEMLDITAMSATAGTDQVAVVLAFATPTSGPIRLNWSAA